MLNLGGGDVDELDGIDVRESVRPSYRVARMPMPGDGAGVGTGEGMALADPSLMKQADGIWRVLVITCRH